MVQQRRYLSWDEMIHPYAGPILQEKFYDCPIDAFKALIGYYRLLEHEIQTLSERLSWLQWLESSSAASRAHEPALLIEMYDTKERNWHLDSSDYFLLFFTLMPQIITELKQLAWGEWQLMTPQETVVRARVLQEEKLEAVLEILSNDFGNAYAHYRGTNVIGFSLREFQDIPTPDKFMHDDGTKNLRGRVVKLLSRLFQIALILRELQDDRAYVESFFLKHMIAGQSTHRGKSIFDLLTYYSRLLLHMCGCFGSSELRSELKKAPQVKKDLERKLREKRRLDAEGIIERMIGDSEESPDE